MHANTAGIKLNSPKVTELPEGHREVKVGLKINGKIVRTEEQMKERIAFLKEKKKDLMNRIKNIDAELKELSIEK